MNSDWFNLSRNFPIPSISGFKKRGAIGSTIVMFVSIVVVTGILIIFVFASGILKEFSETEAGVKVYDEAQTGIKNIFLYMQIDYPNVLRTKFLFTQKSLHGNSFEEARA